jgi:type IV secretion system protein VirB10
MASRAAPLDPRIADAVAQPEELAAEASVRPTVALERSGVPVFVVIGGILLAAILLFVILDSRRRSQAEPTVASEGANFLTSAAPPLYIPPTAQVPIVVPRPGQYAAILPQPRQRTPEIAPQPQPQQTIQYFPQPQALPVPSAPQRLSDGPSVVVDTAAGPAGALAAQGAADGQPGGGPFAGGQAPARVRSSVLANQSTTVVQGTLIPAVLETALDSRRPGFARAIVSGDVRGFDGTEVLIPRGSRLIGEYRSDIEPGQKRALINWTRLIRPDGATIALTSPVTDTLGRGGVRGEYNSHFFERFANAILQSALQIGTNVVGREAGGSVIVALPNSTLNTGSLSDATRIVPTLTVRGGTSISVFVARDLDFSQAARAR